MTALEVDARGLRCPLPVTHLARAARGAPVGTRITVLATDPAARYDIPAWCRMCGHELSEVAEVPASSDPSQPDRASSKESEGTEPAYLRFVVLIRAQLSKAAGTGSGSERFSRPR